MGIPLHRIKDIRMLYGVQPWGDSPIDFEALSTAPSPRGHVIAARITSENPDEVRFTHSCCAKVFQPKVTQRFISADVIVWLILLFSLLLFFFFLKQQVLLSLLFECPLCITVFMLCDCRVSSQALEQCKSWISAAIRMYGATSALQRLEGCMSLPTPSLGTASHGERIVKKPSREYTQN